MEIFTRCFIQYFLSTILFHYQKLEGKLSVALKTALLLMLFTGYQLNASAQCDNAVTSGNFSNIDVRDDYKLINTFEPVGTKDYISVVNNKGNKGARIKSSLNFSLKQTLRNLDPGKEYTISFDFSLYAGDCPSANTALQVEIMGGASRLALMDFNANSGGAVLVGAISFIAPANGDPVTILFTDPKANKPSCGAVIDNLFIFSPLSVSTTQLDVKCFNQSTGSITVTGTGGAGTYSAYYSKDGAAAVNIPMVNQVGTAKNLPAGVYTVTLVDANSCPKETIVTITQPSAPISVNPVKTDVKCAGQADGTISLNPTGGTAPYTYLWSNGATTQNISGLPIGSYSVIVTDANGCQASYSVNIMQPPPIVISTAKSDLSCFGGSNGQISSSVSG
ncbi:MAG TPA: SprB repeat-containing protein, partial [Daejeonella sp.]|nr:SprB repeat-containing protein [Daejeonella sp.]